MKKFWNALGPRCLVATMALATIGQAAADTTVGGAIAVNATWERALSPYVVAADVSIVSGALLTVEPGVVVHFQPNVNLRIVQGAIAAVGTAVDRIVFTSDRDRLGNTAGPGDWGYLDIEDGAVDAGTKLEYTDIRFGRGLRIRSASPSIRYASLINNAGPAIDLDLKSSPVGTGLIATGNQLNGIRVPPGAITDSVGWKLSGIPYVLESGEIAVGAGTLALSPLTQRLAPGTPGSLIVELGDAAPAGGTIVNLSSSLMSVATTAESILVPEGQTSASIVVNTGVVGTTVITASRSGQAATTATIRVANPLTVAMLPSAPVVSVGRSVTVQLVASEPLPQGLTITLDADPSVILVPASVSIAANGSSTQFDVQGLVAGQSTLTLRAPGIADLQTSVLVNAQSLSWPISVVLGPGSTRTIPLTLSEPAPTGGLVVTLQNPAPSIADVAGSVSVAAGESRIDVPITGVALGTTTITASAPVYASADLAVTVDSIAVQFDQSRFDGEPASQISPTIPLGLYDEYTLLLSAPAPTGGVSITISSDTTAVATVSLASITIAEGDIRASVPVRFLTVQAGQAQIRAHAEGLTDAIANLTVEPALLTLEWSSPGEVLVGDSLRKLVTLSRKLNGDNFNWHLPAVIDLVASDAQALGMPELFTIPGFESDVGIPLTGLAVSTGPVTVVASSNGYQSPSAPLIANVVTPSLSFELLNPIRAVGSPRDNFNLQWQVGPTQEPQVAASTQSIQLSTPPGVVDGIYSSPTSGTGITSLEIAAGSSGSDMAFVGTPIATGNYAVQATLAGVGSWESPTTTVASPELRWSVNSKIMGHRLRAYVSIERLSAGAPLYADAPVEISLVSADTDKVSVPGTVTLPAGASSVEVELTGEALTTSAVSISAAAVGYIMPAAALTVTVETPTLQLDTVDSERAIGSIRDSFWPIWKVGQETQSAASTQELQLEIIDAAPANIVDGFYNSDTGGSAITAISIPSGYSSPGVPTFIATPLSAGSYAVRITLAGVGSWTSATTTVGAAELRWSRPSVVIGNRLSASYQLFLTRYVSGTNTEAPPAAPLQIALSCTVAAVCSVPAAVTISGSSARAPVTLAGTGLGVAQIIPVVAGMDVTALDVETRTATFEFSQFPASMRSGTQRQFYVRFSVPGSNFEFIATNPIPLTLASSADQVIAVPASASVAAGNGTSPAINVQANQLGTATITVSAPDFTSHTSQQITVTQ